MELAISASKEMVRKMGLCLIVCAALSFSAMIAYAYFTNTWVIHTDGDYWLWLWIRTTFFGLAMTGGIMLILGGAFPYLTGPLTPQVRRLHTLDRLQISALWLVVVVLSLVLVMVNVIWTTTLLKP